MRLGEDVSAKGRSGVVVKLVYAGSQLLKFGLYCKPWAQWDDDWTTPYGPKIHMFDVEG